MLLYFVPTIIVIIILKELLYKKVTPALLIGVGRLSATDSTTLVCGLEMLMRCKVNNEMRGEISEFRRHIHSPKD